MDNQFKVGDRVVAKSKSTTKGAIALSDGVVHHTFRDTVVVEFKYVENLIVFAMNEGELRYKDLTIHHEEAVKPQPQYVVGDMAHASGEYHAFQGAVLYVSGSMIVVKGHYGDVPFTQNNGEWVHYSDLDTFTLSNAEPLLEPQPEPIAEPTRRQKDAQFLKVLCGYLQKNGWQQRSAPLMFLEDIANRMAAE